MKMKRRVFVTTLAAIGLFSMAGAALAADTKIGFLVKQPEEGWFQDEWKFAEQAAKEKGFTLVKIGVPDGDKLLTAIDNLAAQKAQGFVVCVPDVKLGPAVVARAKANNLKLMTVDDRLVDGAGKPIESVPHMGISAYKIGEQVGNAIAAEIKKRGWKMNEVGAIWVSYHQLPTADDRGNGAVDALVKAGFPKANVMDAPQAKTDTENAFNAANIAITQNPKYKHWVAFGLNDEAALGAVRAAESKGVDAKNMIAIGIGGSKAALNEFDKKEVTGFLGTVLISPKRHGYETSLNMYDWIVNKKQPPALVLTTGVLMSRDNAKSIRQEMGLE